LLISALAWLVGTRGGATPTACLGAGLLAGLLITGWIARPRLDRPLGGGADVFLIDQSHFPASGHYEARVNSIGPLYTNLLRSGFRVFDMESWDPEAIGRSKGVAFVAPQESFTMAEIKTLIDAEEAGSVTILVVGQPDAASSRSLLEAHGLALAPRPLGTVSDVEPGASRQERIQHPRFLDAWPIVAADRESLGGVPGEVIYQYGDDVIVFFRKVGQGGLLLIADTRFFADLNVEDMSGSWPGNLGLIHDVFRRYLGARSDAVRPLFRSPEKPL
jgi:hypothetical protein